MPAHNTLRSAPASINKALMADRFTAFYVGRHGTQTPAQTSALRLETWSEPRPARRSARPPRAHRGRSGIGRTRLYRSLAPPPTGCRGADHHRERDRLSLGTRAAARDSTTAQEQAERLCGGVGARRLGRRVSRPPAETRPDALTTVSLPRRHILHLES